MSEPIVSKVEPVTLVGGADIASDDLNISLKVAPVLVAADGGANVLAALGLWPQAVIGDLDSISQAAKDAFGDVLHRVEDQNSTDFEKALTRIAAPLIMAVGFTGARLDHMLSVLNVMARHRDRRVILLGSDDVAFLAPEPAWRLAVPPGTRLSLMPLGDAEVKTEGLQWDIADHLHPAAMTSPSNATIAPVVTVQSKGPVLVVLPKAQLADAIAAVRAE